MNELARAAPERCLNCGAPLGEPRPRFCGRCGQETNVRAPRFIEFMQQFGGAYFSTEGAFWRTLALLLLRPGELTSRYLAGRRKHYVLPLRLYLSISLLTLVMLRLQVPQDLTFGQDLEQQLGARSVGKASVQVLALGEAIGAGLEDGAFYCNGLPAWVCSRLAARFDIDPKSFARDLKRLPERFIGHMGTAMFLLVPFFALLHKLVYLGRSLRYTEHLVYALHVHCFWFLALAVALIPWSPLAGAMAMAVPLYTLLAAKRVYGGGWFGTLARASAISLLYLTVSMLTLAIVGVWAFFD